jgi:uncharacterized protein (TIGR04255 family)
MMPNTEVGTPFGDPVEEVPLAAAPLIAVIAQVRFPPVVSVAREDFIGPFQERIRKTYPVLRQELESSVVLTPQGVHAGGDAAPVWRFLDNSDQPEWKVSLASSFVALDTSRYSSRADFLGRLHTVLDALAATVNPALCDRMGIRYVDRVLLEEPQDQLASLVKPEVLGVAGVDPGSHAALIHSISDTEYRLTDATLHGRWGRIPPKAQLDPSHGDVVDCPSWILDLDMYETNLGPFNVDELTAAAFKFAERIHRFFRWAIQPDFLRRYGGEV